ncbi:MarR family winged helix-turn-helix transcriptional regulator [Granulicella sibirica]|uniref:Transcriptional regulator, MarR family n=1 Tax=Granulicella sibirica TaxID=2479048 RepID=A0A4Q0T6Z2_9BACT|nr:MarR family transcriptional regulator [Granulicella sibirica]RXH58792.1 Transcriptional regulator, MarR family [Granulicella sibirica]
MGEPAYPIHPHPIHDLFEDVSLGAPENAVGFVLWRVVVRYQREVDRALVPLDLTNLQFVTLTLAAWFGRFGGSVTQRELASFGGIHPMQISQMLKTLERKGFVLRQRSPSDSRAKRVEVTQAGTNVLRKALPRVIEVQQRLFGDGGKPGGDFLRALLHLDSNQMESESR